MIVVFLATFLFQRKSEDENYSALIWLPLYYKYIKKCYSQSIKTIWKYNLCYSTSWSNLFNQTSIFCNNFSSKANILQEKNVLNSWVWRIWVWVVWLQLGRIHIHFLRFNNFSFCLFLRQLFEIFFWNQLTD